MSRSSHRGVKRILLLMVATAATVFSAATAQAWWGPGPGIGAWDPHEAFLD